MPVDIVLCLQLVELDLEVEVFKAYRIHKPIGQVLQLVLDLGIRFVHRLAAENTVCHDATDAGSADYQAFTVLLEHVKVNPREPVVAVLE